MTNRKIKFKPVSPQIASLVQEYGGQPQAVLEMLVSLQTEYGALTCEMLNDVARVLELPAARIYGIASFYSMLEVAKTTPSPVLPKIRVCDGPVCWLCGGDVRSLSDAVRAHHPKWKAERTSCLGLCDRAPAVLVGDEQAGPVVKGEIGAFLAGDKGKSIDYRLPRRGEVRVILAHAGEVDPESLESCGLP
jgi:NADH-quinone oxidoreductase subunit E